MNRTALKKLYLSLSLLTAFLPFAHVTYADNDQKTEVIVSTKEAISDTAITAKVKANLAQTSFKEPNNFSVTTDHGVVFIAGCVQNPQDESLAQNVVKNTSDVRKVINKIQQQNAC